MAALEAAPTQHLATVGGSGAGAKSVNSGPAAFLGLVGAFWHDKDKLQQHQLYWGGTKTVKESWRSYQGNRISNESKGDKLLGEIELWVESGGDGRCSACDGGTVWNAG